MSRTTRQHRIDIAVVEAYAAAGSYLLPDSVLVADVGRMVVPRPSTTEITESRDHHDREGRLTSVAGATEHKRKLNDQGQAWLQEIR